MSKTVVILQSSYIPWKGYLDLMNAADSFVLFDEVQFTRRDWRNRNRIMVDGRPLWLTVPVESKGNFLGAVRDMRISDGDWARKHWLTIQRAYSKAPFFKDYQDSFEEAYHQAGQLKFLSEVNQLFLKVLARHFKIEPLFNDSQEVPKSATCPTARLIEICLAHDATDYLSGPAAKDYIEEQYFEEAGISLHYANYSGYPVYRQKAEQFRHDVSSIDLLMHEGPKAKEHLKSNESLQAFTEKGLV